MNEHQNIKGAFVHACHYFVFDVGFLGQEIQLAVPALQRLWGHVNMMSLYPPAMLYQLCKQSVFMSRCISQLQVKTFSNNKNLTRQN